MFWTDNHMAWTRKGKLVLCDHDYNQLGYIISRKVGFILHGIVCFQYQRIYEWACNLDDATYEQFAFCEIHFLKFTS